MSDDAGEHFAIAELDDGPLANNGLIAKWLWDPVGEQPGNRYGQDDVCKVCERLFRIEYFHRLKITRWPAQNNRYVILKHGGFC